MSAAMLKEIPGCPGYFASSDGSIWSAKPGCGGRYSVHGLVALTFLGPRPDGLVICHLNGAKTDNRVENLLYATQAENVRQGMEGGRTVRGERSHLAKLKDREAEEIVERLRRGDGQAALAREYGVSVSTIWAMKTGRIRRHLALVTERKSA